MKTRNVKNNKKELTIYHTLTHAQKVQISAIFSITIYQTNLLEKYNDSKDISKYISRVNPNYDFYDLIFL
jgi:hypothetical protein